MENIIDYVMTTPGNTNPAILKQKVDEYKNRYDAIIKQVEEEYTLEQGDFESLVAILQAGLVPKILMKTYYTYGNVYIGQAEAVSSYLNYRDGKLINIALIIAQNPGYSSNGDMQVMTIKPDNSVWESLFTVE